MEPDKPLPFGVNMSWLAIRTDVEGRVADALGLIERRPANWQTGIDEVYAAFRTDINQDDAPVFVTPPIGGWTLAAGVALPYLYDTGSNRAGREYGLRFRELFPRLASLFSEVQFFASNSTVSFASWARARNGRVERVFTYTDGEVNAQEGAQTPEEASLGFLDLGSLSPVEATAYLFERFNAQQEQRRQSGMPRSNQEKERNFRDDLIPSDRHVGALADAWSLDPSRLGDRAMPLGVGTLGRMPRA